MLKLAPCLVLIVLLANFALAQPCPKGSFVVGGEHCVPCVEGYTSVGNDATECFACSAGRFLNSAGDCQACPAGTFSHDRATECYSCSNALEGVSESCEFCAPGYAPETICSECRPGFFSEDGNDCIRCPTGTSSGFGFSECISCPDGYYWDPSREECVKIHKKTSSPPSSR